MNPDTTTTTTTTTTAAAAAAAIKPEIVPDPYDTRARELWRFYQQRNGAQRHSRAELKTVREELTAILVDQRRRMMGSGGFDLWLLNCRISRPTAYRLIRLAELARERSNPPAPPPPLPGSHYRMHGDTLTIEFYPEEADSFLRAMAEIGKSGQKIDVAKICIDAALGQVQSHLRDPILKLYNLPLSKFPPARARTGYVPFAFQKHR